MPINCLVCYNTLPIAGHVSFPIYEYSDGSRASHPMCVWCGQDPPILMRRGGSFMRLVDSRIDARGPYHPDWIWQPNVDEVRPERSPEYIDEHRVEIWRQSMARTRLATYIEDPLGW